MSRQPRGFQRKRLDGPLTASCEPSSLDLPRNDGSVLSAVAQTSDRRNLHRSNIRTAACDQIRLLLIRGPSNNLGFDLGWLERLDSAPCLVIGALRR